MTERDLQTSCSLAQLESDVLELFGQFSKVLGYPKSVGEIYGILYLNRGDMSMGSVVEKLDLSMGSVSQGLKVLKGIEAITVRHSDLERRDMFTAETDFGRFLTCFLKDRIQPGLETVQQSIERIRMEAAGDLSLENSVVERIDGIRVIHDLLIALVPALKVVLEAKT